MYKPIVPSQSCARAWVAATDSLIQDGGEGYNVVIDVSDPIVHDRGDNAIIALVDSFLRSFEGVNPISAVANTIFPESLYVKYGAPDFYDVYHSEFCHLSSESKRWGRYFERITRHVTKDGTVYNPLQEMIDKLAKTNDAKAKYRHCYELAIYDPLLDRRTFYGGQCLSFMSFKIHPQNGLMLTAIYRNHTYITRLLGNLIGLGRLLRFIANEANLKVGSLTVISTHASIDIKPWGIQEARSLVAEAKTIAEEQPTALTGV